MNEEQLLESKELRDKNVEHYEVLEKVKGLLLIPGTEVATVQQVADFYEVEVEAIQCGEWGYAGDSSTGLFNGRYINGYNGRKPETEKYRASKRL